MTRAEAKKARDAFLEWFKLAGNGPFPHDMRRKFRADIENRMMDDADGARIEVRNYGTWLAAMDAIADGARVIDKRAIGWEPLPELLNTWPGANARLFILTRYDEI